MLFPVLSGISCVIVTVLLGASGIAVFLPALRAAGINQHNFQHFRGRRNLRRRCSCCTWRTIS